MICDIPRVKNFNLLAKIVKKLLKCNDKSTSGMVVLTN